MTIRHVLKRSLNNMPLQTHSEYDLGKKVNNLLYKICI